MSTPLFIINATCYVFVSYGMVGLRSSADAVGQHLVVGMLLHLIFCQVRPWLEARVHPALLCAGDR